MRLHRIRSDQMYHHYLGDPLEALLLHADGKSELRMVSSNLSSGARPQLLIPGGTFHAARLPRGARYALLGTSVWARPESSDVELANPEQLVARYPQARREIDEYTRSGDA